MQLLHFCSHRPWWPWWWWWWRWWWWLPWCSCCTFAHEHFSPTDQPANWGKSSSRLRVLKKEWSIIYVCWEAPQHPRQFFWGSFHHTRSWLLPSVLVYWCIVGILDNNLSSWLCLPPVYEVNLFISSVRSSNSHPDLLVINTTTTTPLFQITPVLNTGLSLSEPLELYKGYNAI